MNNRTRTLRFETLQSRLALAVSPLDVNGDGLATPHDVLVIVNELGANGAHPVPNGSALDPNFDRFVTPADALVIINVLNDPEPAQCWDGYNNNGDFWADYPFDPACASPEDTREEMLLEIDQELTTGQGQPLPLSIPTGYTLGELLYPPLHGALEADRSAYYPDPAFTGKDVFVLVLYRPDGEPIMARTYVQVSPLPDPFGEEGEWWHS